MTAQIVGSATVDARELPEVAQLLRANRIPPSQRASVGQLQLLALSAATACLETVELDDDVRAATAVIVGATGNTALQRRNALRVATALAPAWGEHGADPDAVVDAACAVLGAGPHDKIGEMTSSVPSRIAIAHRLGGRVLALDALEATAAVALWHARNRLDSGTERAVLVVLADEDDAPSASAAWEAGTGEAGEPQAGRAVAVLLRPPGAAPGEAPAAVVAGVHLARRSGGRGRPDRVRFDPRLSDAVPASGAFVVRGDAFADAAVPGAARFVHSGRPRPGAVRVTDALLDVVDAVADARAGTTALVLSGAANGTSAAVRVAPSGTPAPVRSAGVVVAGAGARFGGRPGLDAFRELSAAGAPLFAELGAAVPAQLRTDGRISLGRTYCTRGARTAPPGPAGRGERWAAFDPAHLAALETCSEAVRRSDVAPGGRGLVVVATPLGTPSGRLCDVTSDETAAALARIGERVGAPPQAARDVRDWLVGIAPEGGAATGSSIDGRHSGSIAAVVADELGLDAVPVAVEAACASTLAAVDVAVAALRGGGFDYALVCGVEFPTSTRDLVLCAALGMLSQSVITPFGHDADGFLPGDGAGALLLLPGPASAAGTHIAGTGGSCDAHSMLAPAADGQRTAMVRALHDAAVDPAGIAYVETHGTGTARGDEIELESVRGAYGDGPITLSAVKSLVGHTFAAAGMAGLLRAVTALEDGVLGPSAGITDDDARRLAADGFEVPTGPRAIGPGPGERTTRAGVSAFGTGGINYHIVIGRTAA